MAEKKEKTSNKFKAVNPVQFKEWYSSDTPNYKDLCDGKSVALNINDKHVQDWINNNIIVKE